jgi:hypothetical protein
MTDEEKAVEVSKILAKWSPVGESQATAIGLIDYDVEAEDILWSMKLHGGSVKRAVSEVLQQAFLIDLDKAELDRYSREIEAVLTKR